MLCIICGRARLAELWDLTHRGAQSVVLHAQHLTLCFQDDNLNDEQQLYARFEALLTEHDFNFKRGLPLHHTKSADAHCCRCMATSLPCRLSHA